MHMKPLKPIHDPKIFDKILKLEKNYEPRKYFKYQLQGLQYSLPTAIKNTCRYIDRNIINVVDNEICENFKRVAFNANQLYNIIDSIVIGLVVGVSVNVINTNLSNFFNRDSVIMFIVILITLFSLHDDYLNEYDLFILPYERQKIVEELEKRLPYKGLF